MDSFFVRTSRPPAPTPKAPSGRKRKTVVSGQAAAKSSPATPAASSLPATEPTNVIHMPPALDPVLRLPKVCDLTGCAKSTWLRYVKDGLAPRGIRLGPNTVGWFQSTIVAWLQSRPQA